jgi:hypothetical protein
MQIKVIMVLVMFDTVLFVIFCTTERNVDLLFVFVSMEVVGYLEEEVVENHPVERVGWVKQIEWVAFSKVGWISCWV